MFYFRLGEIDGRPGFSKTVIERPKIIEKYNDKCVCTGFNNRVQKMITKKQHYVPELLLRRFAMENNGIFRTHIYDFAKNEFRKNQNIKNICAENYTYDKDNTIENFLCRHIETPVGEVISKIIDAPTKQGKVPSVELLRFLLVQCARTPQAYQDSLEFANKLFGTIVGEYARVNGLEKNYFDGIKIEPDEPRSHLADMAIKGASYYPLISDLALHIAINETEFDFIISDHPAFLYNWYLRDIKSIDLTSITKHGVQLFLPISPNIACCLYDSKTYVYGISKKHFSFLTEDDVSIINSFQMLNAESFVVAKSAKMETVLAKLGKQYSKEKTFSSYATNSYAEDKGDGQLRSTHYVWRSQALVPSMPSFVKIKNKIRRKNVVCADRYPPSLVKIISTSML